jgi:hypothetical protein
MFDFACCKDSFDMLSEFILLLGMFFSPIDFVEATLFFMLKLNQFDVAAASF